MALANNSHSIKAVAFIFFTLSLTLSHSSYAALPRSKEPFCETLTMFLYQLFLLHPKFIIRIYEIRNTLRLIAQLNAKLIVTIRQEKATGRHFFASFSSPPNFSFSISPSTAAPNFINLGRTSAKFMRKHYLNFIIKFLYLLLCI